MTDFLLLALLQRKPIMPMLHQFGPDGAKAYKILVFARDPSAVQIAMTAALDNDGHDLSELVVERSELGEHLGQGRFG